MTGLNLFDIAPIMPEILLCLCSMMLLLGGVCTKENHASLINLLSVITLIAILAFVYISPPLGQPLMHKLLISDQFSRFVKGMILLSAILVMVISSEWLRQERFSRFEFPVLILLATLGMMLMVSANDLISLYMGLELTSLCLYVLAAIDRDNLKSTEAGLKYFVLGALASGMLLFGSSLVYGFTGTTNFTTLANLFHVGFDHDVSLAMILVGMILIIVGLCFKISAVPFHMWTPDVYEGAPTPVTAFFSTAPKIAALALFVRVMVQPFGDLVGQWQQIIILVSVITMLVGAFGALVQTNIKRLLAYSSIGHVGYALIGLAAHTTAGIQGILIYLAIYIGMSVGAWGCVLMMRRNGEYVENIEELAGLSRTRPHMAIALAVFMFSMAGIPPLAGFFGKMYIFMAAVQAGLIPLAVTGVLISVVSAFYYLKVVKIMYFDEAREPFDRELQTSLRFVLALCGVFTLMFFLFPTPIINHAKAAAEALL